MKVNKLEIKDTGDNNDFSIIINGEKIDKEMLIGYELKRTAGEITEIILKYRQVDCDINVNIEHKKKNVNVPSF